MRIRNEDFKDTLNTNRGYTSPKHTWIGGTKGRQYAQHRHFKPLGLEFEEGFGFEVEGLGLKNVRSRVQGFAAARTSFSNCFLPLLALTLAIQLGVQHVHKDMLECALGVAASRAIAWGSSCTHEMGKSGWHLCLMVFSC